MAATRTEIEEWFDRGRARGAKYMLVLLDTFNHEDYPVFTNSDRDCIDRYKAPGEMQRVTSVYNLDDDKAEQLNELRTMRIPKIPNRVL